MTNKERSALAGQYVAAEEAAEAEEAAGKGGTGARRRLPKKRRRAKLNKLRLEEARLCSPDLDPAHLISHPYDPNCHWCV